MGGLGKVKDGNSKQKLFEQSSAKQAGEAGIRYSNPKGGFFNSASELDEANAQGYANWAERDYVSKYGDTGRSEAAGSTRPDGLARGGDADMGGQQKKAKRLFSDMIGGTAPTNLISA